MSVHVMECPYCAAERPTFAARGQFQVGDTKQFRVLMECPFCHNGIVANVTMGKGHDDPLNYRGPLTNDSFSGLETFPKVKPIDAPLSLPDDVRRLYLRAADALRREDTDSAAMMIRKTLEVTLSQRFASTGGSLMQRIDRMATDHYLTADMAAWAHEIRLDGNQAAHESGEPDLENTRQLLTFLHIFLLYVFTLPAMVTERKT